ncbi:A-kinase anchor protein 11 isoform X1 [Falco biarmicus]|uniref:A-kinase anchor protein 11 isoform X1 n=1 Tax=Falco biarmicus TaxID=345155 RepID=UPI0024BC5D34|nr:A-kinase anchor protein 11 isoform X1 [Falco biarmicus]XP_056183498.1 A-kinase anchor protein 11 isoform X1 [Falco biarmicus]XP_056183499.1 A-kinase anchor protein 11 isoform X1 [Falco biarmicus]
MDMYARTQGNRMKPRISMKKSFGEGVLHSMKSLLHSRKELCSVSSEECLSQEEQDNFIEITFIGFAEEMGTAHLQELAAVSVELPDVLKSFQLCKLKENEVIFLKDLKKTLAKPYVMKHQNQLPEVFCVMRLSPSFPRIKVDYIFTLLSKYTTGVRYVVEVNSLQKHQTEASHGEDDDTNQSVSSIEDDFVTAFEHLDEDEPSKIQSAGTSSFTSRNHRDTASQTIPSQCLEAVDSKFLVGSAHRKSSTRSSTLIDILGLKELSSVKNSVTTSISDPWIQRSFYKPYNPCDQGVNFLCKTLFSSSPAESSESDCSSPSPIIFLDEEGYQKSLKAKLQLPKIPVVKDGIEDSDSEVSEFFDSFDQFDELEQALENSCKVIRDPILGNPSQKRRTGHEQLSSASITMNPQKFKFDRPTLPANVKKPTPLKPESPYSSVFDVPDSPRPVKTPGEENGGLFSPIRSSAFSPLGSCGSSECLCRINLGGDGTGQNHHDAVYNSYSAYADSVSFEILGSVFHSKSSSEQVCAENDSKHKGIALKEKKGQAGDLKMKTSKEPDKQAKSKHKSLMIRDSIQKFATELVEKSFGSAFKDLQKGVSSCTNALCHLAARLTSSVFQMAFYEIGRRRAVSLKERAINGIASFLVSEAITGALKELRHVKKQIFTNTVARFAADLAEELVFEGIMEVCQFSYPSTPTAAQPSSFDYEDKVVRSYARDLSESVIQEAFIELSQVDVTFTTQAAISVSMDNIKYVSAESMLESTRTSTVFPNLNDRATLKPIQDSEKEYTVQQALFCTSGVVSSIPVPLAGRALCQPQVSSVAHKAKISPALNSDDNMKVYKDPAHPLSTSRKREEEVTSFRNIYLTSDHSQSTESTPSCLHNQNDTKRPNNRSGMNNNSELTSGSKGINTFSGTMVDMIVNEAYEAITSSRVTKAVEEYTDFLTRKIIDKKPYVQCIGEDFPKNMFADHLAKYVIKQSVDESKTVLCSTSENLACHVSSQTYTGIGRKEQCVIKKQEAEKQSNVSIIAEQQQMPLNNPCKFLLTPTHSVQCFSESKDCWQDQKGHRFSSKSPPPCSAVTFARHFLEDFTDTGSCSVTCLNRPSKKHDTHKPSPGPLAYRQADCFLRANSFSSVMFGSEDALQMEDKSSLQDGNTRVMPDTPPPTPLVPCQGSSERNLRKLSKKLKGELAKEFAPATPPSTPYNPSVTELSETEHDSLENEEFMLKLMRSLSEEVESSEDEDHSEMAVEKEEHSEKTNQYADCLASHIISVATEMAASHLDGKTNEREACRQVQLGMQNKRCGYTALTNVPEQTCNSLWDYAGDMAGKVISEAKKIVKSRHCKLLRLKRVNCQVDCLYVRKGDYRSKDRCGPAREQWLGERDSSALPLPQDSGMTGLTSKYPSCESVTDEYADHIIRVLKREGGNAELLMDQYASRLVYRSIKSGLQQAARKNKLRYNRKAFPGQNAQVHGKLELIKAMNKDAVQQMKSSVHCCEDQTYGRSNSTQRTECTELLHFSESLARSITCDVRKKLKISGACLPKSLTDSCLYKKTEFDEVTGDLIKTRISRTSLPFSPDHKLYHSTGSLNDNGYSEGIIQAIEQYARKVADDTLEMSLGSAVLHVAENRKNGDKLSYTEKLSPFSGTVCRCCSMKEHRYCTESTSHHLPAHESSIPVRHFLHSGLGGACQKSRVFQLDIPKIHVDVEQKTVLSDKGATAAIEKAEGELSYTSLTADSGIGQDGVSFAESLTTEIMTSAMTNIGQTVNVSVYLSMPTIADHLADCTESSQGKIAKLSYGEQVQKCSVGREGFHSVESIVSQQMSLSIGDDSTGSWSNLSFEDEHPDESSSFLHLSDSNGNSSSWSSLGLEGDMYEENLSFPTSDSDGTEDKDEDSKDAVEGLEQIRKTLAIVNIDLEPNLVDPQLRATLQWLAASETEVSELYFHDSVTRDFVFLTRRLRERDWKVGDLLQAVLKYCEMIEKASDGEQALNKSLVGWLLENV